MSLSDLKILVIGAGIGGLTVARALALRGADVTVLEQAPEISEVGAGIQVSPNGVVVLRALGLDTMLSNRAVEAEAVSLRDYGGAPVVRIELSQLDMRGYYFLHRADLIDILADGARAAGAKLRLLQKVVSVTPGDRPRVDLANGASLGADLVIGADGLKSKVRDALNGSAAPFFTRQVAWRAVVPEDGAAAPFEAQVFMGPHRHLVTYPLRGGRQRNIVAVQERAAWAAESWSQEDDPMALRAAFGDFCPQAQDMLSRIDKVHLWGLFRHPVAETWHGGGVALMGDAAHPTLPFMAQGACMALEDAWVLADELDGAGDMDARLARYQLRRRDRTRRIVDAASGNAWKYHLSFGPLRWAAHTAMRLGGAIAPERMARQFDWIYGHDVTALSGRV